MAIPDDYKLCGFLRAVLAVDSSHGNLSLGSECSLFHEDSIIGFRTDDGVILSILCDKAREIDGEGEQDAESCEKMDDAELENSAKRFRSGSGKGKSKSKGKRGGSSASKSVTGKGNKRKRGNAIENKFSMITKIQALVSKKSSLKVQGTVILIDKDSNGEERAVVLVDVYVPIALWSGREFPIAKTAASLFHHLSCDWEMRSSILNGDTIWEEANGRIKAIWDLSDCHVFDCKLHCKAPGSPERKLFKLHEIFQSLPSPVYTGVFDPPRVSPSRGSSASGMLGLSNDVMISIMGKLNQKDLVSIAGVCRHLRSLAFLIVPCMNLKLFPHQQAALGWMLKREKKPEVLPHPLYSNFDTEDGFSFYINVVTGDIITEEAPMVEDFRGGMFCDEPGLGKTITALSLILKTQGTTADPPEGIPVIWCTNISGRKSPYYERMSDPLTSNSMFPAKRCLSPFSRDAFSPLSESKSLSLKKARPMDPDVQTSESENSNFENELETPITASLDLEAQPRRSLGNVTKNLLREYGSTSELSEVTEGKRTGNWKKCGMITGCKRKGPTDSDAEGGMMWIQCDTCSKWRRVINEEVSVSRSAWHCSNSNDPASMSCKAPELLDRSQPVTYLQGFHSKGDSGGDSGNISFFTKVLRQNKGLVKTPKARKALDWLDNLPLEKLTEMETTGLPDPLCGSTSILKKFGLQRRVVKGVTRWYYPKNLENLVFDLPALKDARCQPLDTFKLYLSKATLIVVPANLVDHWITQIEKHVNPGQLSILVWTEKLKILPDSLAWNYDVVITTFSRLSAEWDFQMKSPMLQVHWLRVMLDEGHTLGSSFSLTNKSQMLGSLIAGSRWILTGTPTPNTPNSQLSHLHPLLKFLHEQAYGENQKFWEAGILKPFEAEMEEGRSRLLQVLQRCMISSRKKDLRMIPPCIKKLTYLNFVPGQARSYNELVETVRRNILLADWNDPSHVESLLNGKQWKLRSVTINNVRLSCCVAGHITMINAGEDIKETMDALLEEGLVFPSEEYFAIQDSLINGCSCTRCGEWCRFPVITPCKHLLCLACVALDSEKCTFPGCGKLYEMQTPETLARPENPEPKWAVPKDLIELQPSYKQDAWNPDWQSTSSSKVSYLVNKLKELHEGNKESISSFNNSNNDNLEETAPGTSIVIYGQDVYGQDSESEVVLIDKVIVFSQFLEHIEAIQVELKHAGIKFARMYSPMPSPEKRKSLATFQHDADCMVLLMDGSAALGLDLSFVTHVFLMEPIWDKSMEEQVISRAHRMGAKRPINVETLIMRGTIEEQMMKFLEDAEKSDKLSGDYIQMEKETTRCRRSLHDLAESNYLARLDFVRSDGST